MPGIKLILAKNGDRAVPGWLEVDRDNFTGKVVALATKADIDYSVQENLIVEFYSR
jgi:small subunit ribosomal protein S4